MRKIKVILSGVFLFLATSSLYGQKDVFLNHEAIFLLKKEDALKQNKIFTNLELFIEFINKNVYAKTINKDDEKQLLREKWKELLRIDLFYPYFLKKDIEKWISEKTKIEFFNLKGKATFEDNQIKYIFKIKF